MHSLASRSPARRSPALSRVGATPPKCADVFRADEEVTDGQPWAVGSWRCVGAVHPGAAARTDRPDCDRHSAILPSVLFSTCRAMVTGGHHQRGPYSTDGPDTADHSKPRSFRVPCGDRRAERQRKPHEREHDAPEGFLAAVGWQSYSEHPLKRQGSPIDQCGRLKRQGADR